MYRAMNQRGEEPDPRNQPSGRGVTVTDWWLHGLSATYRRRHEPERARKTLENELGLKWPDMPQARRVCGGSAAAMRLPTLSAQPRRRRDHP
jgi:hypothetical protein